MKNPSLPMFMVVAAMSMMAMTAIVAVSIFRPETDNTAVIGQILALVVPTVAGALAYMKASQVSDDVKEIHVIINSKMDKLLTVTASAARAEGVLEGAAVTILPPAVPPTTSDQKEVDR